MKAKTPQNMRYFIKKLVMRQSFSMAHITEENGVPYLKALFRRKKPIRERILKLDANRFQHGDLP
jgi:hypothetical protein